MIYIPRPTPKIVSFLHANNYKSFDALQLLLISSQQMPQQKEPAIFMN
jgi:hypothetical protein